MKQHLLKSIVLCLALCLLLPAAVSCQGEPPHEPQANEEDYFSIGEIRFAVGQVVTEETLAPLGAQTREPEEAPNCAFDGKGKLYSFSGFEIETYVKNGLTYFYGVYFLDDSISTEKGITIGSTKDEVIAAYGQADDAKEGSLTYRRKGMDLVFFFRDDRVTRIHYLFTVS